MALPSRQCRSFEALSLRLITTYTERRTEWVPDAAVRWDVLDGAMPCADRAIGVDRRRVWRARPGEVLMMKESTGSRGRRGGCTTRPPIEHLGVRRLVLVIRSH